MAAFTVRSSTLRGDALRDGTSGPGPEPSPGVGLAPAVHGAVHGRRSRFVMEGLSLDCHLNRVEWNYSDSHIAQQPWLSLLPEAQRGVSAGKVGIGGYWDTSVNERNRLAAWLVSQRHASGQPTRVAWFPEGYGRNRVFRAGTMMLASAVTTAMTESIEAFNAEGPLTGESYVAVSGNDYSRDMLPGPHPGGFFRIDRSWLTKGSVMRSVEPLNAPTAQWSGMLWFMVRNTDAIARSFSVGVGTALAPLTSLHTSSSLAPGQCWATTIGTRSSPIVLPANQYVWVSYSQTQTPIIEPVPFVLGFVDPATSMLDPIR